jgi:hypothetical protein
VRVPACSEGDRASLQKSTFEVVEKVSWVFDTDA